MRNGRLKDQPSVFLPLVLHFFCETEQITELNGSAVVQKHRAGKTAEDLMLVTLEHFEIRAGGTVDHGNKIQFEASVIAGEFPGFEIILFSVFHGTLQRRLGIRRIRTMCGSNSK